MGDVKTCKCIREIIPSYLSSIGALLVGLAAVCGVYKAPEVVKSLHAISILNQRQSQSQNLNVTISPNIKNKVRSIIENPNANRLEEFILDRSKLDQGKLQEQFFIAPEFKAAALMELESATGGAEKEAVLLDYYNKSLKTIQYK